MGTFLIGYGIEVSMIRKFPFFPREFLSKVGRLVVEPGLTRLEPWHRIIAPGVYWRERLGCL